MRTLDIFGYSFSAIKLRKFRAALTTLGVIIGIAAIVALLSITQGLQATITSQLNQGLSADTLIVTAGGSAISGGGGGFGGFGGQTENSGFSLYTNYTQEIDALSPDIANSVAIISRSGYIVSENLNRSVTIYGVDYATYQSIYTNTFKAEIGSIPTSPSMTEIVVGTRVNQPSQN